MLVRTERFSRDARENGSVLTDMLVRTERFSRFLAFIEAFIVLAHHFFFMAFGAAAFLAFIAFFIAGAGAGAAAFVAAMLESVINVV